MFDLSLGLNCTEYEQLWQKQRLISLKKQGGVYCAVSFHSLHCELLRMIKFFLSL